MAILDKTSPQRIARLTPLSAIVALIEARVGAVAPRKSAPAPVLGATLAADVVAPQWPPRPIALRDGFAVEAAAIADAGPYAPAPLPSAARRLDGGEPLPNGADAVLPLDAVNERANLAEAVAAVSPGEGVLPAGGDASPPTALRRAGERLRAIDRAVMAAAGIAEVTVREPRVAHRLRQRANDDADRGRAGHACALHPRRRRHALGEPSPLEAALTDDQAGSAIAIGGTGSGQHDIAVHTLARLGRVEAHGIAVSPGETAAFGFVGTRPVLLVPGRLDAALAIWLLIGRHVVAKLAGGSVADTPAMLPLKRKVASTIGLTEFDSRYLRRRLGGAAGVRLFVIDGALAQRRLDRRPGRQRRFCSRNASRLLGHGHKSQARNLDPARRSSRRCGAPRGRSNSSK